MATVRVLVVAGGGGGSAGTAGGGGAGGVVEDPALDLMTGTYPVTVGAGGRGSLTYVNVDNTTALGENGEDSTFATITAQGGGHGANSYPGGGHNGGNGGSGGGGGRYNSDEGEPGLGSTGGDGCDASTITHQNGGGGGGGGGASGDATTVNGADGVASDISGTSTYYGGGGGGAGYLNDWGNGGLGGGGKGGATVSQQPPTAGEDGTGGGGGAGWTYADSLGMAGGSGIVIVRYPTGTFVSATGGTVTIDGSDTIHTFTASGSFVCEAPTAGLPPIALTAQALGTVVLDDGVVDSVVIASSGTFSVALSAAVVS